MLKIKSILPLTMIIVGSFIGCEKNTSDEPEIMDSEIVEPELEQPIETNFVIKNLAEDDYTIDKEGYGELNFLGFGYDVTGKYSHRSSVKEAVINTPVFGQDNPSRLDVRLLREASFNTVYGADSEDFTKWLTGETADVNYFKGNIMHPFPDTDPNGGEYIYGLYDTYIRHKRLRLFLNPGESQLLRYLTINFQTDSKSLEPAELVKKYGTHVLLSLFTGAKLSLDYQAEYLGKKDRRSAVENSFRIGINDCFGLFSGFLDPADSIVLKDVADPIIAFEAIGGDPSKILVNNTSGHNPKVNISEWSKSINEDNYRFVYIDGLDSLLPISELIEDMAKKQKVEIFINEYIKANEVKVNNY
ncbi:hypothetical protein [Sphingobacterium lumbrici]|uniref:hypothetical protein n=1 Tax=Sphingobacterium lumbrici TaxID=2559600 RepID=UPI00112C2466|nr:hypothetical protein [Sphingobacterium lumbrici]